MTCFLGTPRIGWHFSKASHAERSFACKWSEANTAPWGISTNSTPGAGSAWLASRCFPAVLCCSTSKSRARCPELRDGVGGFDRLQRDPPDLLFTAPSNGPPSGVSTPQRRALNKRNLSRSGELVISVISTCGRILLCCSAQTFGWHLACLSQR